MIDENSINDIAIIGMACRFPGANTPQQFWHNIRNRVESITHFNDHQLKQAGIAESERRHKAYIAAKGIVDNVDMFDANFFDFSAQDAKQTDPQIRLFLECAWEALEIAGYCNGHQKESIGVFAGTTESIYLHQNMQSNSATSSPTDWLKYRFISGMTTLCTQVSYRLNLKGPSINLNTACSTGLTAVITACNNLINFDCDIALAGSSSIEIPQVRGYLYKEGGMKSSDGHCRCFDKQANGTVFSNGVGVVVLKRLSDAIRDQDTIYAVIKGFALNNDGAEKEKYTVSTVNGQARCIAAALAFADVNADTIDYVEAHSTAIKSEDQIEIAALTHAYRSHTDQAQYCAIGSVKSNIGHTDIASGIAGLIKVVMALHHKEIPASLHYDEPNPEINFSNSPFYVNTQLKPWTKTSHPRRGAVSAFGIGGTNTHIILQEHESPASLGHLFSNEEALLLLSAKNHNALLQIAENLADTFKDVIHSNMPDTQTFLASTAHTLSVGRKHFYYRQSFLCKNLDDAIHQLHQFTHSQNRHATKDNPRFHHLVFLFPAQQSPCPQLIASLYKNERPFQSIIDSCCEYARAILGTDLRDRLFTQQSCENSQPLLFIFQYALARLLMHWGIKPKALIAAGVGEITATCLADAISLQDALKLLLTPKFNTAITAKMALKTPQIPCLSSQSGTWISVTDMQNPQFWVQALNQKTSALTRQSIATLLKMDYSTFIEISTEKQLSHFIAQQLDQKKQIFMNHISPKHTLLTLLEKLWLNHILIDWNAVYEDKQLKRIPLPTYPFQRQHYWIDSIASPQTRQYKTFAWPKRSKAVATPAPSKDTCIIPYRKTGTKKPLFLIHPAIGEATCFMPLAALLDNQRPIYFIQDPSIHTKQLQFKTIEDYAAYYMKECLNIQQSGPYLLCGLSFGATVAVEMSRQLQQKDQSVALLGLLDGWANYPDTPLEELLFKKYIQSLCDNNTDFKHLSEQAWQRIQLLKHYQPSKLNQPITLFKAKDLHLLFTQTNSPTNHWEKYSTQPITTHVITGDHDSFIKEPHVTELAKYLNQHLDSVI